MYFHGHNLTSRKRSKYVLRFGLILSFCIAGIIAKISTAGFQQDNLYTFVEIDGIQYGQFDHVDGLGYEDYQEISTNQGNLRRVTLTRDFITDPSMYLWAKNIMKSRTELKDIHVVVENSDGEELTRYVLKHCQPISWTVEAANPALGGFHEKIDLAVQEVDIY